MATGVHPLLVAFLALLLVGTCQARPAPRKFAAASAGVAVDGVTAIYNFGDSISDTGNFLREGAGPGGDMMEHTVAAPYGAAIGGATGRCSDGYLMIDYLAKDLGLPLLNPYLDEGADFTHGVNFAVTGATALDTAALRRIGVTAPHTNSSLSVQLQRFKDFMEATTKSPAEAREKLANALVMVGEIGNDYNYAFAVIRPRSSSGGARSVADVGRIMTGVVESMVLVPEVVRSVTSAAREVLDMGATRVVIPGNFPLGCVPSYLEAVNEEDAAAYDGNGCLVGLNLFAQMHNVLLQQGICELRRSYPEATIAYADYFNAYVRMLEGARDMGFDGAAVTKACCGAGDGKYSFDMERLGGAPGTSVCARPEERLSWDGIHLTQRAYGVMAELLYHKGFASPAPVKFPRQ
uniref:Esterase n=1 Tax=Oryza brachyantha TaxID=4533 RepID=J3LEM5_ORYBR